jgi:hypothetical protein
MPDNPDLTSDFAGYGWFGLNPDGSVDTQDKGQGAWGANTRDPTLRGVALPEDTIRRYIGDPHSSAIENAILRGAYQVEVTSGDGRKVSVPIVDIGPGKSTGRGIDLTYATAKALGLTDGTGVVHYRLYAAEQGLQQPQASNGDTSGDLPPIEEAEGGGQETAQTETPQAAQTIDPSPLGMFRQQHPEYAGQSDEDITKKLFQIKSFGMQQDEFAKALKDPNGATTIKQAQAKFEQAKNPLQRFMDQNPQYAGQEEAVKKKLFELYKPKHPQVTQDEFNHLLEPDGGHQSWAKVVADTTIATAKKLIPQTQVAGMELWKDLNEMENTAIDRNLDSAFGMAYPDATTPEQKQAYYSKFFAIKDQSEREKAFIADLTKQPGAMEKLQQQGKDVTQVVAEFDAGMNGLEHRQEMEKTHAWMGKVVGQLDKESQTYLPEAQEKVATFLAQQPANLIIAAVPGLRETGNYAMLVGQNRQYLETKMPTLGSDQIDQMARKMADVQFPAQEVASLIMMRGGGALTAGLTNKVMRAIGDVVLSGGAGAAAFTNNQLIRNLTAKQPLTQGIPEAVGEGFAVGAIGGGMGLTVRGISQFLSTSMKGKQVSGTLEKVSIMTPKEANDFAEGGSENPVVQSRDYTALDLGIAATEQHAPDHPALQEAKDARDAGNSQEAQQHLDTVLQDQPPETHEAIASTIRSMVDTLVEKPHERTQTPATEWKELGAAETEADVPAGAETKVDPKTGATSWRMPARDQQPEVTAPYFGTDEAPREGVEVAPREKPEVEGTPLGFMPEDIFKAGRRTVGWLSHFTHFDEFAKKWNNAMAPERNAQEARDVAQIGRGTVAGEKNQAVLAVRQIAEANNLDSVISGGLKSERRAQEFTKYGKAKLIEMISARERGQKIGDEKLDKLFDFYNSVTDYFGKRALANGLKMDSWIDNYFPHMIKGDKATQAEAVSKIKRMWGDPSFTKHRQIPTTDLAVKLGYEMRSYNPEHVIQAYVRSVNRAISQVQLLKQMEAEGYAWNKKDYVPDIAKDWPEIRTPDGVTRHVAPDTKPVLDNMFSLSSIYDTLAGPGTRLAGIVKGFTGIKFAWSGFHAVHIMGVDLAQALASVEKRAMRGTLKGEDFMNLLGRATGPVEMVRKGGAPFGSYKGQFGNLIEVMRGEASPETLSDADKINRRDLLEMGIVPHVSHDREMAWTNWISQQANKIGPASKVAGLGYKLLISEPYQKYMFGKLIPALKISSALEARDSLLRENPNLRAPENKIQRMREYDRIQRDIEGRFGEMNYDNLLWNGMAKQLGINVPTSLGWTLGFWRIYGDGVTDTIRKFTHLDELAAAKLRGEKPELITERMLYMANYSALAMISCTLASYAATGAYHGIMDAFFPAVGTDKQGKPVRVRTPFFTTEWASLYAHYNKEGLGLGALDYFGNKLNPGLQTIWELIRNKDFRGREVRDPDDPWPQQRADDVWFAVKNLGLPISFENQLSKDKVQAHEGLAMFLGLSPAPTWTGRTGAENDIMNAYFQEKGESPAMSKAKADVYDAKKVYQQAIVDKDPGAIAKAKAELHRLGVADKTINDAERTAATPPADRLFKYLSNKRQIAILKSFNPQQRAHYLPLAKKEVQHEWYQQH